LTELNKRKGSVVVLNDVPRGITITAKDLVRLWQNNRVAAANFMKDNTFWLSESDIASIHPNQEITDEAGLNILAQRLEALMVAKDIVFPFDTIAAIQDAAVKCVAKYSALTVLETAYLLLIFFILCEYTASGTFTGFQPYFMFCRSFLCCLDNFRYINIYKNIAFIFYIYIDICSEAA